MKLSVAMIVRNESTEIRACLDSLLGAGHVDEIAIVDTGSIDDTHDQILAWAADHLEVLVFTARFEWVDDFAAARNFANSLCNGDWILALDADCRLAAGALPVIREACESAVGRTLKMWQGPIGGGQRNDRIWLYRRGVSWAGIVHEAIEHDDGEWVDRDRILVRYGWSTSHAHDVGRNLRLLQKAWDDLPTARTAYYLGSEHWDHGRLDEALPWFERCLEISRWTPERADALLYLAKILWQQHRGDEARVKCLLSLGHVPSCREALELMAEMSYPEVAPAWRSYATLATNTGVLFVRSPCPTASPAPSASS